MSKSDIVLIVVLGILFLRNFWLVAKVEESKWRGFVLLSIALSILVILFSNNTTVQMIMLSAGLVSTVLSETVLYREKQEVFLMTFFIALSLFAFGLGISLLL
jgi:hypothetical protein